MSESPLGLGGKVPESDAGRGRTLVWGWCSGTAVMPAVVCMMVELAWLGEDGIRSPECGVSRSGAGSRSCDLCGDAGDMSRPAAGAPQHTRGGAGLSCGVSPTPLCSGTPARWAGGHLVPLSPRLQLAC